jgi:hypothetical protein
MALMMSRALAFSPLAKMTLGWVVSGLTAADFVSGGGSGGARVSVAIYAGGASKRLASR